MVFRRSLSPLRWMILAAALPVLVGPTLAEKETESETESEAEAETEDPNRLLHEDFEDRKAGKIPGSYFALNGEWTLAEVDEGIALKLAAEPLAEAQLQLGDSMKDTGGRIRARIKADRKRRSLPRFGIGLHGASGYRLRLFPVQSRLELVKADEVMQSIEMEWHPGEWWFLELSVEPAGDAWTVTGRAWAESEARPEKAQIDYISTDTRFFGKPSVTGTPFAGLPIWFDDIEVWKSPAEDQEENAPR